MHSVLYADGPRKTLSHAARNAQDLRKRTPKRTNKMSFRVNLLRSAAWAGIIVTPMALSPAYAQEEQADRASFGLEEITVTGTRRSESLIDAPVAVSVFSETTIERAQIEGAGDFLALTPNATFVESNQPGELFITIRGNTQTRLGDTSVALSWMASSISIRTASTENSST
jgi:outer membrane receptor protein involved in Fe transport